MGSGANKIMNEKESETWEINQFNFGLVKFDSPDSPDIYVEKLHRQLYTYLELNLVLGKR